MGASLADPVQWRYQLIGRSSLGHWSGSGRSPRRNLTAARDDEVHATRRSIPVGQHRVGRPIAEPVAVVRSAAPSSPAAPDQGTPTSSGVHAMVAWRSPPAGTNQTWPRCPSSSLLTPSRRRTSSAFPARQPTGRLMSSRALLWSCRFGPPRPSRLNDAAPVAGNIQLVAHGAHPSTPRSRHVASTRARSGSAPRWGTDGPADEHAVNVWCEAFTGDGFGSRLAAATERYGGAWPPFGSTSCRIPTSRVEPRQSRIVFEPHRDRGAANRW